MDTIILDYRADEEIVKNIEKLGFNVIPTMKLLSVSEPLCGHADMQICKLGSKLICCPECYNYYRKALAGFCDILICGKTQLSSNYPCDIAYNIAWIGDYVVHNFEYTDFCIYDHIKRLELSQINVLQGYSKCNICVVANNAVITSDFGIYKSLLKNGVDSLLVSSGNIDIFGWNYGFIGGASGKLGNNTLAFCGDLTLHPDCNKIISFCNKYNVNCISLSKKRLMDYGSIISVNTSV